MLELASVSNEEGIIERTSGSGLCTRASLPDILRATRWAVYDRDKYTRVHEKYFLFLHSPLHPAYRTTHPDLPFPSSLLFHTFRFSYNFFFFFLFLFSLFWFFVFSFFLYFLFFFFLFTYCSTRSNEHNDRRASMLLRSRRSHFEVLSFLYLSFSLSFLFLFFFFFFFSISFE